VPIGKKPLGDRRGSVKERVLSCSVRWAEGGGHQGIGEGKTTSTLGTEGPPLGW